MNYIIIDIAKISEEMFKYVEQTSINVIRKNKDNTKGILKSRGIPSFFRDTIIYTNKEIMEILKTDEWKREVPNG